jgi:hypothetical protein
MFKNKLFGQDIGNLYFLIAYDTKHWLKKTWR